MATTSGISLGTEADEQRERLLRLHRELRDERARAVSPAVGRFLELADTYLFLGLGSLGYTDELFPTERPG